MTERSPLTPEDRAAIALAINSVPTIHCTSDVDAAIYRAGIAAERERCAIACVDEMVDADSTKHVADEAYNQACRDCAAAIRQQESR
jgi:hypothetical protein